MSTTPPPISSATNAKSRRPRREALPRVAFSIAEGARMLGKNAAALRRQCERLARLEGDLLVARLPLGIRATKDGARWYLVIPRELLP